MAKGHLLEEKIEEIFKILEKDAHMIIPYDRTAFDKKSECGIIILRSTSSRYMNSLAMIIQDDEEKVLNWEPEVHKDLDNDGAQ